MKIAVISDVHGNLAALQAVLADIEQKGADTVCSAGDLVGYGPFPYEVIGLFKEKRIASVMGNFDYTIGNSRVICRCRYKDEEWARIGEASIKWTLENTTEKNKEFLRQLPFEMAVGTDNYSVRIVHGSPRRNYEYMDLDLAEEKVSRLLFMCQADILVCGHTHIPYVREIGNKLVVNAGSVGQPKHGDPRASYCIIEIDGKARAEVHFVEYDFTSTAAAIIKQGLDARLAEVIRTGTV